MKKSVISLIFILFLSNMYNTKALSSEISLIDKQLSECIEKDYSTTNMNKCTYEATEAWQKEVEIYYIKIKKKLNAQNKKTFIHSHQCWQKYYENEKKLISQTIYNKEGTIYTNIAAGIILNIVKERALYLKYYLSELTGF